MAKKKKADAADGEPAKGGKKKIMMILVVLLLVGGGAGAYLTLGSSKAKAATKPKPVPGTVLVLNEINLNLAGGHYLKLGMALQLTKAAPPTTDGSQALDLAISQLSGQTMLQLGTAEVREKAKQQLLTAVEKAYNDTVMDIYFTEFVMQ